MAAPRRRMRSRCRAAQSAPAPLRTTSRGAVWQAAQTRAGTCAIRSHRRNLPPLPKARRRRSSK
eukprot:6214-Eustigmatos_ZCMA.PRE.1